jgi:hypothetical protein
MDYLRLILLLTGLLFFSWGALILGSNKFYRWWRDSFWKEANDGHLSRDALIFNKYIEGAGTVVIGAALMHVALFY